MEQEKTRLIYFRHFRDAWCAMEPNKLKLKNQPLNVFSVAVPEKTHWAPEFLALYAVEKAWTFVTPLPCANYATEPENGVTDYPAPDAKA